MQRKPQAEAYEGRMRENRDDSSSTGWEQGKLGTWSDPSLLRDSLASWDIRINLPLISLGVCQISRKLQHTKDFPNKQKGLLLAYQTKAHVSFH